ncbi:MAG: hypothetical protein HGA22_08405 [Clostridiales bacterium]|nr:hypothetical protein [Clostridiales bacterium]
MEYLKVRIRVLDSGGRVALDKYLRQLKLSEESCSTAGLRLLGTAEPCARERRFIENTLCIESASRLKFGYKYSRAEAEWFFELYGMTGEYVIADI